MTTRRNFIEHGLAIATAALSASVLPTGISAAPGLDAGRPARMPLERVLFDERFAVACRFGEHARGQSVSTSAIDGQVHDLWYSDLYYRWRDDKSPVAGMTDFRTLFLLEMVAADAGMRVVHRVHHHNAGGSYLHRLFGPMTRRLELQDRLARAQDDWPQCAADIVTGWPSQAALSGPGQSDILQATTQALDAQTPISWIIC